MSRMVRLASVSLLFGGLLTAAHVQADDEPDCSNAQTQAEMTQCAGADFDEADQELNAEYQKLRKLLATRDKDADEGGKGAVEALVAAQRAWVAFRDANCDLAGFQARGGTMEPMLISSCMADMSRKRTEELQSLSEQF
ncbi:lysozyme inhibitor LprI family protein [Agrobacterium larrymoorei]|uniref:Lysozyme inhibitor LprI family protein n=2 Tax=Agrobacterium larrymoorei TaxID=160699 RepID=A0AAF0KEB0_9HYPH|nr:lysozyme inhibitor LprI family protein [Agrobacterium larrymoorei]WHA41893.1 lysozyme inhibitor LprI family protein [Agrobacterium larrymoorei]